MDSFNQKLIFYLLFFSFAIGAGIWLSWTKGTPAEIAAQQEQDAKFKELKGASQQTEATKLYLCRVAAACTKYDAFRLDCATAGNFKNCLRIKMGNDADFIDTCSGGYYNEGSPAVPLSPDTPNAVDCFFRALWK